MAIILYSLLYDRRLFGCYVAIITVYSIVHYMIKDDSANTNRAKLRYATWDGPSGPEIYAKKTLPMKPFEDFVAKKLKEEGVKITLTHVALKAMAHAMAVLKGINGKIIFGRFVQLPGVGINTLIDIDGTDLAQFTFKDCEKKSITDIAKEMREHVIAVKSKKNTDHKQKTQIAVCFDWVNSLAIQLVPMICYNLGLSIPALKLEKNQFGTCMVTNVSGLGYRECYAPLCDFTRNVAVVVVCEPYWNMTCDQDGTNQRMEKVFNWMQTTDHRFLDGAYAVEMYKALDEVWKNPSAFDKSYEELNKEHRYYSTYRERKAFLAEKNKSK